MIWVSRGAKFRRRVFAYVEPLEGRARTPLRHWPRKRKRSMRFLSDLATCTSTFPCATDARGMLGDFPITTEATIGAASADYNLLRRPPRGRTLRAQEAAKACKPLALPQFPYLRATCRHGANPLCSRLYYILSAHETGRLIAAKDAKEETGAQVRAAIYGCKSVECASPTELPQVYELLANPLAGWRDNVSTRLRNAGATTPKMSRGRVGGDMCFPASRLKLGWQTFEGRRGKWFATGPSSTPKRSDILQGIARPKAWILLRRQNCARRR